METIEEKYRCVQAVSRQGASVEQVCRELEVSRSGYYDWLNRKPSERSRRNQALRRRLVELHEKYPAMGLDSLYHLLKPEFGCSRKRVHRQMRLSGISSVRRQAYRATTNSNHSHPIAPNLLKRHFTFEQLDQAWVGDLTYIPTGEGWLYLAIVKDMCTRKTVGYTFSDRIDTQLTLAALDMAYHRRRPAKGLIFHSDRGVQYATRAYREQLEAYGIRQSMSRRGDPQISQRYADPSQAVSHQSSGAERCVCLFRGFLQHSTPALGWISPAHFEAKLYTPAA